MNKKMISLGLAAAILLQIGVLAVEYLAPTTHSGLVRK